MRQYIDGTYMAQYQFKIIYRSTAVNADERLEMDEVLNDYGAWAEQNISALTIGENIRYARIKRDATAALFARYQDDVEDHQILFTLTYEVM